jgi:hypothetical protein
MSPPVPTGPCGGTPAFSLHNSSVDAVTAVTECAPRTWRDPSTAAYGAVASSRVGTAMLFRAVRILAVNGSVGLNRLVDLPS